MFRRHSAWMRAMRAAVLVSVLVLCKVWYNRAFAAEVCETGNAHGCEDRGRRHVLQSSVAALSASAAAPPALAVGGDVAVLNNGMKFPKASFGLQIYNDDTAQQLTEMALSLGYRNFFSSVLAGNQPGFAKGWKASGIPREEVFICGSVVSNRARGFKAAYRATKRGCDANLAAFLTGGITYVDMMMLDYPGPDCDSIKGQWEAFEEMLAAGQTKNPRNQRLALQLRTPLSKKVSNFSPEQLDCLLSNTTATPPAVNQLPFSISYVEPNVLEENKKRGILVQAWAPLGGSTGGISKRAQQLCGEIGKKYGKSWAQVALRWIVDQGATFSTQTRSKKHFQEDIDIFDFKLSAEDLATLEKVA